MTSQLSVILLISLFPELANTSDSYSIRAETISNPLTYKPPRRDSTLIFKVTIPWLDRETRLLIAIECKNQNPPLEANEAVAPFIRGLLEKRSIPTIAKTVKFYKHSQRYTRCSRSPTRIEWSVDIPIRPIGFWEVTKVVAIPFRWNIEICEWKILDFIKVMHNTTMMSFIEPWNACRKELICKVEKTDFRKPEYKCIANQKDCLIECLTVDNMVIREFSRGTLIVASLEKLVTVECLNESQVIYNSRYGAMKVSLPCGCTIQGDTEIRSPGGCIEKVDKRIIMPYGKDIVYRPVASAATSFVKPFNVRKTSQSKTIGIETAIVERTELWASSSFIMSVINACFSMAMFIAVVCLCRSHYRTATAVISTGTIGMTRALGDIPVQVGPDKLYPTWDGISDTDKVFIVIVMTLDKLLMLSLFALCCMIRRVICIQ